MTQADNFTQIPNDIMDALAKSRIPGEERQCLDYIIRKTLGYHKTSDAISNSQFVKATGLRKQNVNRSLNNLVHKKIVIKNDYSVIKADYQNIPTYRFNLKFEEWALSSKLITVIKNDYTSNQKRLQSVIKTESHKRKKETLKENICHSDSKKDSAKRILARINELSGKRFTDFESILAVLNSKKIAATEEDCLKVVEFKYQDEFIRNKYFTPSSLFKITKFRSKIDEANNAGPTYEPQYVDTDEMEKSLG